MHVERRMRAGCAALVVAGVLLVAGAEPAAANHTIDWGAGRACGETSKTATTTVGSSVPFIACVAIGGDPLPGHEMQLVVEGPTRTVESQITTGSDGTVRFAVQPTAAGDTRVTLCDADGCLYGTTVITATPAAEPTTTAPPAPAPTTTAAPAASTTTAVPSASTTIAAAETTTTEPPSATSTSVIGTTSTLVPIDGDDASSSASGIPWWLVPALLVLLVALVVLISILRRRWLAPTPIGGHAPGPGGSTPDDGGPPVHVAPPVGRIRPIIFVPGIMATALTARDVNGDLQAVWPPLGFDGNVRACLESLQTQAGSGFEVDSATGDGLLDGIHAGLIRTLNGHGYKNLGPKPNLYIYPYNWMQSCYDAGAGLARLISHAESEHGVPPGIIAHSMGGIVVRSAWHRHGAKSVDRVMYIGSPHLGASMAYFVLHPQIDYSFLGGTGGDVLNAAYAMSIVAKNRQGNASTPELLMEFVGALLGGPKIFDSTLKLLAQNARGVFELLPDELYFRHVNPQFPVAVRHGAEGRGTIGEAQALPGMEWIGDGRSDPATVPQPFRYTRIPSTWNELYIDDPDLRLPVTMHDKVAEAMAFKESISGPLPPENPGLTMIVHGATQPTNSTAAFTPDGAGFDVTLSGRQGGDGTVPRLSGIGEPLWAGAPTVVVENSVEHFRLTEAPPVHRLVRSFFPPGGA